MNRDIHDPGYREVPLSGSPPSLSGKGYVPFSSCTKPAMCTAQGKATHKGRYYLNSCSVDDWAATGRPMHTPPPAEAGFFAVWEKGASKPVGSRLPARVFPSSHIRFASALNQRKGRAPQHEHPYMRTTFFSRNDKNACGVRFFSPLNPPGCVRSFFLPQRCWLHNDPGYLCVRNSADLPHAKRPKAVIRQQSPCKAGRALQHGEPIPQMHKSTGYSSPPGLVCIGLFAPPRELPHSPGEGNQRFALGKSRLAAWGRVIRINPRWREKCA